LAEILYERRILDVVPSAILIINASDHKIAYANHSALAKIGRPPEQVIGVVCHSFICPAEVGKCPITNLGQTLDNAERTIINQIGERVPVLKTVVSIELDGSKYLIESFWDFTERKRAEEALKASESRFRELTDILPEAVLEQDLNGTYMFMNPAGLRRTGYDESDLKRGLNAFQLVAPEDHDVLREGVRRILNGAPSKGQELTIVRKDGSRYPVIAYAAPIVREGMSVGLTSVVVDITERKKLEARLADSQRLVAIGEATAMIGHDLRNPLQAMDTTVYLLKDLMASEQGEEVVDLLSTLNDQIHYMNKIVSDLQDYARPVGVDPVETNLLELVNSIVSDVRAPSKVEVTVDCHHCSSTLKLDTALLRRVLTNLILNAVQAMPNGGKLTIIAKRTQESIILSVQDTGTGISAENMGRVFKPFFTTKAQGQGLGLAVCKRLVEAMGGSILVKSEQGKGSTFTVSLPIE